MRSTRLFWAIGLALSCTISAPLALADEASDQAFSEKTFSQAVTSLERGAYDDAIDLFESLADRGFVHPDASFDRAVAYVERARTPNARPGDLGRAVAALEETLLLRPGDADAERAVERVRAEIARRRARQGAEPLVNKTSFARAIVGLADEKLWAVIAAAGSALLTFGLAGRFATTRPRPRLAAVIVAAIGAALFLLFGPLALAARHFRKTSEPAVVVVPDARLLDENATPIRQKDGVPEQISIPEGASLFVRERRGALAEVEWGTTLAWVNSSQLRVLARK